jgi:glutathione peroxidase
MKTIRLRGVPRLAPVYLPGAALIAAALLVSVAPAAAQSAAPSTPAAVAACPPLLNHTVPRLQDEKPQNLCQYAGRVLLVVNTASYCGFTSQFEDLEVLNAKYAARGLVVLGFPSNDFKQEDADAKKTADVCFNTYGVKFPMFAAGPVRGSDAQPLFKQLAAATGSAPSWNFNKYLVGRDGKAIAHFGSTTGPTSSRVVSAIEQALAAPAPSTRR